MRHLSQIFSETLLTEPSLTKPQTSSSKMTLQVNHHWHLKVFHHHPLSSDTESRHVSTCLFPAACLMNQSSVRRRPSSLSLKHHISGVSQTEVRPPQQKFPSSLKASQIQTDNTAVITRPMTWPCSSPFSAAFTCSCLPERCPSHRRQIDGSVYVIPVNAPELCGV